MVLRTDPLLRAKIMAMSEEGAELGVIGSLRKMYSSGDGSALQRYVGMCVQDQLDLAGSRSLPRTTIIHVACGGGCWCASAADVSVCRYQGLWAEMCRSICFQALLM